VTGAPARLVLHIDGASRGNPGEAGFGVHVTAPDGGEVASLYGYLGEATNNVAEYQALVHSRSTPTPSWSCARSRDATR
jgi:ribonuclease HI